MHAKWISVLAVLLLAGCAGPAPDTTPATENAAAATDAADRVPLSLTPPVPQTPPVVEMRKCRSMDLLFPFPVDESDAPPPLRPKPYDAAGVTTLAVFSFQSCEEVLLDGAPAPEAQILGWIMFPVEPAPELRVEGADAYYWLELMVVRRGPFIRTLADYGVDTENASMNLAFTDVASNKGMRALFRGSLDSFEANAATTMLGLPAAAPAQKRGIYTGEDADSLRVHGLDVTARTVYERGIAQISPPFLPVPTVSDRMFSWVPAAHQVDFDARWRLSA